MKEKIKVGRKVYLKPVNNAERWGNKEILEAEIVKVGRKYFELDIARAKKYYIETLKQATDYAPDYELYFSRQEILDEREYEQLFSRIESKFSMWAKKDLTLDQLKRIMEIISE